MCQKQVAPQKYKLERYDGRSLNPKEDSAHLK